MKSWAMVKTGSEVDRVGVGRISLKKRPGCPMRWVMVGIPKIDPNQGGQGVYTVVERGNMSKKANRGRRGTILTWAIPLRSDLPSTNNPLHRHQTSWEMQIDKVLNERMR